MSTADIWDTPGFAPETDYIKFDNVGDTVTGKVMQVTAHTWDDGSVCPKLLLDVDGEERSLTAGQIRLKAALAEQRPRPGDTITITFREVEKRPGGKTLKHFDVVVVRAGAAPAATAPAAAPAAPAAPAPAPVTGVDPAALAAAGLNPEQIAAMQALNLGK